VGNHNPVDATSCAMIGKLFAPRCDKPCSRSDRYRAG